MTDYKTAPIWPKVFSHIFVKRRVFCDIFAHKLSLANCFDCIRMLYPSTSTQETAWRTDGQTTFLVVIETLELSPFSLEF